MKGGLQMAIWYTHGTPGLSINHQSQLHCQLDIDWALYIKTKGLFTVVLIKNSNCPPLFGGRGCFNFFYCVLPTCMAKISYPDECKHIKKNS